MSIRTKVLYSLDVFLQVLDRALRGRYKSNEADKCALCVAYVLQSTV